MPALPPEWRDAIKLADWLELTCLESGDKNASAGDLVRTLQIRVENDNAVELSLEAISEVEQRIIASGNSYPFALNGASLLQVKDDGDWHQYIAYIFCLCLSYYGWQQETNALVNPWLLFEELSCIAAEQYVHGKVFPFGKRCSENRDAFTRAVNDLCKAIGEGQGLRPQTHQGQQDDGVDLVAWRDFEDMRESKLLLFGQCASGENWKSKRKDLDPSGFWRQWMSEGNVSPLIRSFFMPHRVVKDRWAFHARKTDLLFDRCRLCYWAWANNSAVVEDSRYLDWVKGSFQ